MSYRLGFLLMPKSGQEPVRKAAMLYCVSSNATSVSTNISETTYPISNDQKVAFPDKVEGSATFSRFSDAAMAKRMILDYAKKYQFSAFASSEKLV